MYRPEPHHQGGRDPRMGRRGPDFEQSYEQEEYDPEQDSDDDGMGRSRHATRGGPPGREGAGPYRIPDDLDPELFMPPRGGVEGNRRACRAHQNHDDYTMQLALLDHQNIEAVRRRAGLPPRDFVAPPLRGSPAHGPRLWDVSAMSSSRHPHAGGRGPRGPQGELLDGYIDAEDVEARERYGGGHGPRGGGGPSHGRERGGYPDDDEDSEDEGAGYPPASSRRHSHASRGGRSGYRLH